jgi:putative endonuclease
VNRREAEKRGRAAETLACWYLRLRGWRILARRARVPGGELVMGDSLRLCLVFYELIARADAETAAFSLDEWRLRRVAVAAERLMARYMDGVDEVRIDAIFIVPFRWPRHLENVWQG